jgi:hypothetical protein
MPQTVTLDTLEAEFSAQSRILSRLDKQRKALDEEIGKAAVKRIEALSEISQRLLPLIGEREAIQIGGYVFWFESRDLQYRLVHERRKDAPK